MITKVEESNLFLDFDKLAKSINKIDLPFLKKGLDDKLMNRNIYAIYDIQNDDILLREQTPYSNLELFLIGNFYKYPNNTKVDKLVYQIGKDRENLISTENAIKKVKSRLNDQIKKFQKQIYDAIQDQNTNELEKITNAKDRSNNHSALPLVPQSFIEKDIDKLFSSFKNDNNFSIWNLRSSFMNLSIDVPDMFLFANSKNKKRIINEILNFIKSHETSNDYNDDYKQNVMTDLIQTIINLHYNKSFKYQLTSDEFSDLYLYFSINKDLHSKLEIDKIIQDHEDKTIFPAIKEKFVSYIDDLPSLYFRNETKNVLFAYSYLLNVFKSEDIAIIHPRNHQKITGKAKSNILSPYCLEILSSALINTIDVEIDDDDDLKYFYRFIQMMYSKSFKNNSNTSPYLDFKYILDKKYKSQLLEISNHLDHMLGTIVTNNFAKAMLEHITWK